MDASLYGAAAGAIVGVINANTANQISRTNARTSNALRDLNNQTLSVVNQRNATLTSLQRWAQDVRNSRVDEAIGRTQEALTVNFNRNRDARTRANFSDNIRQAEEAGRIQASAAVSGVTGSVVDVIDYTRRLKNGIKNNARVAMEGQIVSDEADKEFEARWALEDQKDHSIIFDNPQVLDYRTNTATESSLLSAGLAGAIQGGGGLKQVAGAFSGFFKEPKAEVDLLGFPVNQ